MSNSVIIVQPQEQSPVIVEDDASKTPIKVTTDMDYSHVAEMIDKKIGDIDMSAIAKESTLTQVASKVEAESQSIQEKIDAIPATDLSEVAKESTLNAKTDTIAEKIGEVLDKISTTFTLSIVGQKGRHNISLLGTIEDVQEGSTAYMEGNTLHIPNGTMNGNTLMLANARMEGNTLYL